MRTNPEHTTKFELIRLMDSWISIDPVAGCNGCCKYCYLNDYYIAGKPANCVPSNLFIRHHYTPSEVVKALISYEYYSKKSIITLGNYTDLMLHSNWRTFLNIIIEIDRFGLPNNIGIITKFLIPEEFLEKLIELNVSENLFFVLSYSGLPKQQGIEPKVSSKNFINNLEKIKLFNNKWKIIHFWRPLTKLNACDHVIRNVVNLIDDKVDAVVCIGLKWAPHLLKNKRSTNSLFKPLSDNGEEAITKQDRIEFIEKVKKYSSKLSIFFHTSCAVSYLFDMPDYNGSFLKKEICEISYCPPNQRRRCKNFFQRYQPTRQKIQEVAKKIGIDMASSDIFFSDSYIFLNSRIDQDQHRYLVQNLHYPIKVKEFVRTTEWVGSIAYNNL